jgi:uncharacterized protein (TIGR03435 family)
MLRAQAVPAPRFEVAAIKPTAPDRIHGPSGAREDKKLYMGYNRTLKDYLWRAYFLGPDQIVGGPPWLDADRFDIEAKAEQLTDDAQFMKMLQTLLVERFHLRLHRESRTGESLVLEVSKKGPQLQPVGDGRASYNNANAQLDAKCLTMGQFAEITSRNLKLPVVDHTGLTGAFTFTLQWNPDADNVANDDDAAAYLRSEISRAISQQLGLSLKIRRGASRNPGDRLRRETIGELERGTLFMSVLSRQWTICGLGKLTSQAEPPRYTFQKRRLPGVIGRSPLTECPDW